MPPDDPKPNAGEADAHSPAATVGVRSADISQRPALPEHPERMAADIEDEEADPVIDTGPGIADGVQGQKKQRG